MSAYLIYKQHTDHKTGNPTLLEPFEVDKKEDETNRYVKLYNLQRTMDEKNSVEYFYMHLTVI